MKLKSIQKIIDKIRGKYKKEFVTLKCDNPKGHVLVSYLKDSVLLEDSAQELNYHSNQWESREIARIFNRLGYEVDVIDYENYNFVPSKKYNVIFDIHKNLHHLKLPENCIRMYHLTGSYAKYNNMQEKKRREYLLERKNNALSVERYGDEEIMDLSLEAADVITIVGNAHTISTFPEEYRNKIKPVPVTSSKLGFIKNDSEYLPKEKEFLWFAGYGAVHKGLDLLLDVFSNHPEWKLNIIGSVDQQNDFVDLYRKELYETDSIKYHGFLSPSSDEFINVIKKCFCYINPSCAESTSTASVTALSVGFYPIISYDNGITLPDNCGIYLKDCTIEEIENSIEKVMKLGDKEIIEQIQLTQNYILNTFSRENFTKLMTEIISSV